MKKRIMAINANDFGGGKRHLMGHRYFNNRDRRYHTDWKYWAKLNKTETFNRFKEYIIEKKPDILIIEEMLISEYEKIDFIGELAEIGYFYLAECLPETGNYSLTMTFYKEGNLEYVNSPGNYRGNRSAICKDGDVIICGSHFPCESDEAFLGHMSDFVIAHLREDLLLIGDLNANVSPHS